MKKLYAFLFALLIVTTSALGQVRIYEVYGGGGNAGATHNRDYITLINYSATPQSITGWTLQYASSTGNFTVTNSNQIVNLSGTIPANSYWLVAMTVGTNANGSALPVPPDQTGTITMAAAAGKVALAKDGTVVTGPTGANVEDFVGYGTAANQFRGTGPSGNLSATTSARRPSMTYVAAEDNNSTLIVGTPTPNYNSSSNALPVTYLNFQANYTTEKLVAVSWATVAETDNAHFEVERSTDAASYISLGRVGGKGTTTTRQTYTFTDEAPAAGWNYYRLRQVDRDGTASVSRPVAVLNENALDNALTLMPNPASTTIRLALAGGQVPQYVSVVGLSGHRTVLLVSDGDKLNVTELPAALYLIEVQTTTGRVLRQRLLKQ